MRESEKTIAFKKWLRQHSLNTVCQSAGCPNLTECFQQSTATFLILGNICTRHCRFCGIIQGKPLPIDRQEPDRIAHAVEKLDLQYVIITSVTRDDLPDQGAEAFSETVRAIRNRIENVTIEILVPDFNGSMDCIRKIIDLKVDVFAHNVETVPRLYSIVRPQADFQRSLSVLKLGHQIEPRTTIKSGLMLGLGETHNEIIETLNNLLQTGCQTLTLGQYLMPSKSSYPVQKFLMPEQYEEYQQTALQMGFAHVASGPYVRSSYHAIDMMN